MRGRQRLDVRPVLLTGDDPCDHGFHPTSGPAPRGASHDNRAEVRVEVAMGWSG